MAIKQSLEETFPTKRKMSLITIVRILDGHLYSLKSIQAVSVERNSDETKRKRAEFSNWFLSNVHMYSAVVYVDECGYNLWTRRSNGRAPKGTPAVRVCCRSRGKNLSLILGISPQLGLLINIFISGSVDKMKFESYINSLSQSLPENNRILIILDNA